MSREEILATLRRLGPRISSDYRARVKGIFGSRARGEEQENSDLDVLVDFQEEATLYNLVDLADFLEETFGCKVDVVSNRALRKEFRSEVQRDLVLL
jgi:predicted nucleotidyltransferase